MAIYTKGCTGQPDLGAHSKEIKNEYDQSKSPWDKQKDRNRRRRLVYATINHNKEINNEFNPKDRKNGRVLLFDVRRNYDP